MSLHASIMANVLVAALYVRSLVPLWAICAAHVGRFSRQKTMSKRIPHRRDLTSVHFFSHIFGLFVVPIYSFICKGCKLLECQKRALALCILVMEAGSVLLDMLGKNKLPFLLVAFLLSAFSFALTLYVSIKDRTKVQAERQMKVVEIVFSVIQLVVTFLHFLLTVVDVKNNFNVSIYPLAFAIIAVVFVFRKDKKVTNVPLVNPQTTDSMPSTSIQIDPEPLNSLTMRCNARPIVVQANRQVNHLDVPSQNIEVNSLTEKLEAEEKNIIIEAKPDMKEGKLLGLGRLALQFIKK